MSRDNVYVVTAYKWGEENTHSYVVGVYTIQLQAVKVAAAEEERRGGKYSCAVVRVPLNAYRDGTKATIRDKTPRRMELCALNGETGDVCADAQEGGE